MDKDSTKEKLDQQVKKVKEVLKKTNTMAALAYFPLIGWIIPKLTRKGDPLIDFHGKQSMLVNLAIVLIYLIVFILENFPLTGILFGADAVLNPITGTIWIISALAYVAASGWAAWCAYRSEEWSVPYIHVFSQIISRIIKLD